MMRKVPPVLFYCAVFSFLAGTAWGLQHAIQKIFLLLVVAAACFAIICLHRSIAVVAIVGIGFAAAGVMNGDHAMREWKEDEKVFARIALQEFSGEIIAEPDARARGVQYRIELDGLEETILVFAPAFPRYRYGDRVEVEGKLEVPENFSNEYGIEFNYKAYLAKDGLYRVMYRPAMSLVSSGNGNNVIAFLYDAKQHFISRIGSVLHAPGAELLSGMIFGVKQSLGDAILEDFRRSGLIHLVVLSGANVTIIVSSVLALIGWTKPMAKLVIGGIFIVLFSIMVGGGATVIRAALMASIALYAAATKGTYSVHYSLWAAAFCMAAQNPLVLLFDPSFQLSFVATLGLLHISGMVKRIFFFVPTTAGLQETVVATLSAQFAVTPLLVRMMGQISIISPISNILVVPIVAVTMLIGFIAGALAYVHAMIALPFATVAALMLGWVLWIAKISAALPYAVVPLIF